MKRWRVPLLVALSVLLALRLLFLWLELLDQRGISRSNWENRQFFRDIVRQQCPGEAAFRQVAAQRGWEFKTEAPFFCHETAEPVHQWIALIAPRPVPFSQDPTLYIALDKEGCEISWQRALCQD